MNGYTIGALAGLILAFFGLAFGLGGFLIALLLGAVGALIGGIATGRLNLRAAVDAAQGRSRG
ncbi:hypothetical protein [Agrococcus jejuensis]|uniref:hypothetical protein n=1 Tax=Agrococcus jejuensis TaxID=399736 RepID=UPI00119DB8A2|nr:hypothetical protein [Agrococcus jejuensis]